MGLIRFAIENPVKVAVAVILVILFGMISVLSLPIQLTPDVDRPVITVMTAWPGASPQEVESEIIDEQEERLKSVSNLAKMKSTASEGTGTIRLEFPVGVDKEVAFTDVSDKLRQVPDYPERVDDPVLSKTDDDQEQTIAWMILNSKDGSDVSHLKTFVEDKVKPLLERAEGIADVPVYGGRDREVQVVVDPYKLAARGISFGMLQQALQGQNANISAGSITKGKRDYTYRTLGEFRSMADIEETVITHNDGGPVFVRDIATVVDGFAKQEGFVRSMGEDVLAMPARRETGANVIVAMKNLQEQIAKVNEEILHPRGLHLRQVYDQTVYIWSAINLVVQNIFIGGALAIIVLLIFLRSGSATGIVAMAIPISVVGTFLIIAIIGRPLNVIMMAGMAFAVGMVVDNAIVVLENIYRHRAMGKSKAQAALEGAAEVWGAVLASTLTTIAVFLPVIFVEEEAGQLFRDIAIAITAAVALSLVVSVLVIPPLSSKFFAASHAAQGEGEKPWVFAVFVSRLVATVNRSFVTRFGVVLGFTFAALLGSWVLAPATEYLPAGNQNLIFGMLFSPPGYSIAEYKRMAHIVEDGDPENPRDGIRPLWEAEVGSEEIAKIPPVEIPVGMNQDDIRTVQPPPIENFFFVGFGGVAFMGCTSAVPDNVAPLEHAMGREGSRVPGVFSMFRQMSLFSMGDAGNSVDIEIRGDDQEQVNQVAYAMLGQIMQLGYGYPSPDPPNFHLGRPEIRLLPNRTKAADLGLSVREVGFIGQALVEGAFIGEYNDKGDKIDIVIKVEGTEDATIQELGAVPVYAPSDDITPIASFVEMESTVAPQQINHIEEMKAVTLAVSPKTGVPLQATMHELRDKIITPMREGNAIPKGVVVSLAGTADKLTQTQRALLGNYEGVLQSPRIAGLSVPVSMVILFLLTGVIAALIRALVGVRWSNRVALILFGALVVMFLALNPDFALTFLESRMVLALIVTYLLMAALFESYVYPFVIMFSVPLAAVGGFAALSIVHTVSLYDVSVPIQQLDVLTMLGFVILIGIVVNNAILLVHQALNNVRDHGMEPQEAIANSVLTRTRPIFMSALTSIFGMLPLVVMPGAGSELYRGLGSVVLGGLLVSTVFTLLVVPVVFSLVIDARAWFTVTEETALAPSSTSGAPAPANITRHPDQ